MKDPCEYAASSWHNYPKLWALGGNNVRSIFDGNVVIQEKVDGSQISFGNIDGVLKIKSKNRTIDHGSKNVDRLFADAVKHIRILFGGGLLNPGWTYRAEVLSAKKHNTLEYGRVPQGNLVIYDIECSLNCFLCQSLVGEESKLLGCAYAPVYFDGTIDSDTDVYSMLSDLLLNESFLGGPKIEGLAIKNYSKTTDQGHIMMAKFVSDEFREQHAVPWKKRNPGSRDILKSLTEKYKTEQRWMKSIFALRDSGVLDYSARDIGLIVSDIQKSLSEEESDHIKDVLYSWAWRKISRGVVSGLPEFYKKWLLEESDSCQKST